MSVRIEPENFYRDGDVRLMLDVPSSTLARARREGTLRYTRRGKRVWYRGEWLLDWLDGGESLRIPNTTYTAQEAERILGTKLPKHLASKDGYSFAGLVMARLLPELRAKGVPAKVLAKLADHVQRHGLPDLTQFPVLAVDVLNERAWFSPREEVFVVGDKAKVIALDVLAGAKELARRAREVRG